jgi:hypothetical protein
MDRMTSGTTRGAHASALAHGTRANARLHAKGEPHAGHGERRHSFRVPVEGRASIWLRGRLHGHYALSDLSITGCALREGPDCDPGDHVEVVLHLPDRPLFWLGAQVRRCSVDLPSPVSQAPHASSSAEKHHAPTPRAPAEQAQASTLGLCFEHTDPRSEDRLQDLVVEVYTRMHADSESFSLVIDTRSHVRRGLVDHLDSVGERAIAVATPLDAVQLLLESGERVLTAFIGPDRSDAPTYELVEFLAHNYPRVRRVLIGDAGEVAGAWIAEATGEVHGLLETPCSEEQLRRLVHRISSLPHEELS